MIESNSSSYPVSVSSSSKPSAPSGEGADYWQYHLDCWRASGMSQSDYCRHHGLNYKKFHNWKSRLTKYPSSKSVKLVEVKRDFSLDSTSRDSSDSTFGGGLNGEGSSFSPQSMAVGTHLPGVRSGIRFWVGEFCIEVDVPFSSPCLSQLIGTLRDFQRSGCDGLSPGVNETEGSGAGV